MTSTGRVDDPHSIINVAMFRESRIRKGRSVSPENQIIPKYLGYLNTSLKTSLKV